MYFFKFMTLIVFKAVFMTNCWAGPVATTSKIVVIVNKDAITLSDLDNRINLLTLISGLSAKQQNMEKMRGQVLLTLIQEKIQIQAAKNKKIDLTDKEVDESLASMAKSNNMSYESFIQLLATHHIPKETMFNFMKAQLAWVKYIRHKFSPLVHVTDNEVDQALDKLKEAQNHTRYQIEEILLPVNNPTHESTVKQDALKLYEDLKAGANFSLMAQQFSKNLNSPANMNLNWKTADQIDPSIAQELATLKTGQISKPIRTPAGFKIVKLKGVRQAGQADPNETTLSFCQAFLPLNPSSNEEEINAAKAKVDELTTTSSCNAFKHKLNTFGIEFKHNQEVFAGQLPEQLKEILIKAQPGKVLEPLMTEQGLLVQMVCDKKEATLVLPEKEDIRADIEQQKMHQHALLEMQSLRSKATLEFKDATFAALWK